MKPVYAIVLVLLCALPAASLQTPAAINRAKVADFYGTAEKRVGKTPERWVSVVMGDLLPPDSAVRTSAHAAILLQMPDKHSIRLGENTFLELKEVGQSRSYSFQLITGEIWSFVNKALKPAKYEVETPSTVLGVTGTVFNIAYDREKNVSRVSVNEGTVSLRQGAVTQSVAKGFETRIRPNQLQRARVLEQGPATQKVWKTLLAHENFTKPDATPKLNKDLEKTLAALKKKQEEAIAKQEEAAEKKAAQDAAKKAAQDAATQKATQQAAQKAARDAAQKAAQDAAAQKAAQKTAQKKK